MLHSTPMAREIDESATFTIVGEHIVGEVFDGEAIIIDTITGAYYSMPDGAAQIWAALAAGANTVDFIAATSTAAHDRVEAVLGELVAAELVVTTAAMPERADGAKQFLTKYSDMEELLLLDPIHDVAPAGWPAELNEPLTGSSGSTS